MIEITNITPVNKGTLLATCDVYIQPWDMDLLEVKVFQKGSQRWIGMPSREFTNSMGEKKYIEQVTFRKDSTKNRFRSQISAAIDKFLEANPNMEMKPLINLDEPMPF